MWLPALAATATLFAAREAAWGFLGGWLAQRLAPVQVTCDCAGGPDRAVLALLERQLERCGPESLASGGAPLALLAACFFLGVVVGVLGGFWLAGQVRVPKAKARLSIEDQAAPAAAAAEFGDLAALAKAQVEELRRRRDGAGR